MIKFLFTVVTLLLFLSVGYLALSYHIVQTKNGYQLVERKEMGLSDLFVDTRGWNAVDYLKNSEISVALAEKKLDKVVERVEEHWNELTDGLDDLIKENDLDDASDKAKRKVSEVKKTVKKKYDKLVAKLEAEKITAEEFKKKVAELRAWADQEIKEIKAKFA